MHTKVYAIRSQTTSQWCGKTFKYMLHYPFIYYLSGPRSAYYITVLVEGAAKCLNPSIVHMVQLANQKLKQRLVSIFLYIGIVHIMPYTPPYVCHACRSVSVWVRRKLAKLVLVLP